jgi:hypothetical protein
MIRQLRATRPGSPSTSWMSTNRGLRRADVDGNDSMGFIGAMSKTNEPGIAEVPPQRDQGAGAPAGRHRPLKELRKGRRDRADDGASSPSSRSSPCRGAGQYFPRGSSQQVVLAAFQFPSPRTTAASRLKPTRYRSSLPVLVAIGVRQGACPGPKKPPLPRTPLSSRFLYPDRRRCQPWFQASDRPLDVFSTLPVGGRCAGAGVGSCMRAPCSARCTVATLLLRFSNRLHRTIVAA